MVEQRVIEVLRSTPLYTGSFLRVPPTEIIPALADAGTRASQLLGFDAGGNPALYAQAFPSANPLFGTRVTFTGATTATNAQKGNVFLLGGNTQFDLTIGNPTTYDADWSACVINIDVPGTGRRKRVSCPTTSQIYHLYPEEWCYVFRSGAVLIFNPATKRWRPRLPVTVNVHPTSGNDANDGFATGTGAYLTIQPAIDWVVRQDHGEGGFQIKLADGAHTRVGASVMDVYSALPSNTALSIVGNNATPGSCIINAAAGFAGLVVQDTTGCGITGVRFNGGAGSTGISMRQHSICDYGPVEFGAMAGGVHVGVSDDCTCGQIGTVTILGDAATHVACSNNSYLNLGSIVIPTARAFTVFASAAYGGRIQGGIFTGSGVAGTTGQRFIEQFGGRVDPNVTYPGNAAGSSFEWPAARGTAALPVFSNALDNDTGMFSPAANRWGVSAGGVSRATWGDNEGPSGQAYMAVEYASGKTARATKSAATAGTAENVDLFYDGSNQLCGAITINPAANTAQFLTSSGLALKMKFDASGIDWGAHIDALWVGDYERKADPGTVELGLVAEWLAEHLPWAVVHSPDGPMVDYGRVAPLALWGVKNARARIAELERRLAELMARLQADR